MKKIIIVTAILLAFCLVSCDKVDYNLLKVEFESLLNAGDFIAATTLYQSAEDERIEYYKQALDTYAAKLIDTSVNTLTFAEARVTLSAFSIFEHTKPKIEEVLVYLNALEQSNIAYVDGTALFASRDFDAAKEKLSVVQPFDVDYQNALDTMAIITARQTIWQDAAANLETGRHPSINSITYKDDCIYFPNVVGDVHSIVKYNDTTGETLVFPLFSFTGAFHIKSINVIGDYIYFIAGEDVGRGDMFKTPYNIYEMKTDGTELTMVKSGNYFDLISYGDTFYALSYSKGLVMMDKDFSIEEVLSDKNIFEMYVCDRGVYYTEKLQNTYNTNNVLHLYSNGEHTKILDLRMLHVYFFDGYSIYYHDIKRSYQEAMYIADATVANPVRLAYGLDLNEFLGAMDGDVIFSTGGDVPNSSGDMRQDIYAEIEISSKRLFRFQDSRKVPEFEVLSMFYEKNLKLVQSTDGTIALTNNVKNALLSNPINIPLHDDATLQSNMEVISSWEVSDEEFFSLEEVVVVKDSFWYYSSPALNVTVEMIYEEYLETNVFIANIRTKDPTMFSLGYYKLEPTGIDSRKTAATIAAVNKAVWASNGDIALEPANNWTGTVIRDGKIYKKNKGSDFLAMYPDGTMVAYYGSDDITYQELIDAGVQNTLSFGPILVRDNKKTPACEDYDYYISGPNPRCAWGMVEPGHYINILADGRQSYINRGMSFYTISNYFLNLGCSVAYNLDGGQSTAAVFLGNNLNSHEKDNGGTKWNFYRTMPEIVFFGQSELVPSDLEQFRVD